MSGSAVTSCGVLIARHGGATDRNIARKVDATSDDPLTTS